MSISSGRKTQDDTKFQQLQNELKAQKLAKQGNIAQFIFCGQLEIQSGKIKVAILQKDDIQQAIDAIQETEELVASRKQNIQIADSSKTGWMTIQHQEKAEKTGISSEDQKRVAAAEEAAEKELETR